MEIPTKRNLFSNNVLTRDHESFRSSYAGSPPWDIGKPQPAFQAAADKVVGSVLDAGCGTGEHALFFGARGHAVTGFDFLEEPITAARRKAAERSPIVKFLVKDALKLHEWTERFTMKKSRRKNADQPIEPDRARGCSYAGKSIV